MNKTYKPKVTRLTLNITPVGIPHAVVDVGTLPYESKEQMRSLRRELGSNYFVKREGDRILAVSLNANGQLIGKKESRDLESQHYLVAGLVRTALLNYLLGLKVPVLDFKPVVFIHTGTDLLRSAIGDSCPSWLSVRLIYSVDVRPFFFDGQESIVGIVTDIGTVNRISATCDILTTSRVSILGRYVQIASPREDPRLEPKRLLIGRVSSIDDGVLLLDDHKDEMQKVAASQAYLEQRTENLDHCIRSLFPTESVGITEQLRKLRANVSSGPEKYARVEKFGQNLRNLSLDILPGVRVTIEEMLAQDGKSKKFPRIGYAPKPEYLFSSSGNKADSWHERGLEVHGPYDRGNFSPTKPSVIVVCEKRFRGRVEEFLNQFREGIPNPDASKRAPFTKGFVGMYALEGCDFTFCDLANDSVSEYRRIIVESIDKALDEGRKIDLAIVQIQDKHHQLHGNDNPYFVTKALLLSNGIPSQELEIETMTSPDSQRRYILNNVALSIYAKLGGIPWLLKSSPAIAHELVFGLGSASVGSGRFGERERFVGITTVFSGDGKYILENRTKEVTFQEYQTYLHELLTSTIDRLRTQFNWQQGSSVRLVFHAFKPFGHEDADTVKDVVSRLTGYDVEYAFLHLADNHPICLFDKENASGSYDFQRKIKKGIYVPQRGLTLQLNDHEVLLTMTGDRELKRPEDGIPHPLSIRFHRDSTFRDITYLSRQVFAFSCHSWRSFFPSPMPVTILYSDLIAGFLGNLSKVEKWNPDAMMGKIGRTRWFL